MLKVQGLCYESCDFRIMSTKFGTKRLTLIGDFARQWTGNVKKFFYKVVKGAADPLYSTEGATVLQYH